MKRKIKTVIIIASAISVLSVSSAMAYFSHSDTAENKVSIGVNTVEIEEDYSKPDDVNPGDSIIKNPSVKCTEGVDCYVRMYCEFTSDKAAECFDLDFDTTNWTEKQDDGYYYYKTKISLNESTTPLFKTLTAKDGVSELTDADLICYAESVQAMNSETGEYYSDYQTAWKYWNDEKGGID